MTNTFLKRRITAGRLFEAYVQGIPLDAHLFLFVLGLALAIFACVGCHSRQAEGFFLPLSLGSQEAVHWLDPLVASAASAFSLVVMAVILRGLRFDSFTITAWMVSVAAGTIFLVDGALAPGRSVAAALLASSVYLALGLRRFSRLWAEGRMATILLVSSMTAAAMLYPILLVTIPCVFSFIRSRGDPWKKGADWSELLVVVLTLIMLGSVLFAGFRDHPASGNHCVLGGRAESAWALIAAPGRSIFLYSPVLLLALVGWRDFRRAFPLEGRLVLSIVVTGLVAVAVFERTMGRLAWQGEPFAVFIPVAALPAASALRRRPVSVSGSIVLLGMIVQALAVFSLHYGGLDGASLYRPLDSPPVSALRMVFVRGTGASIQGRSSAGIFVRRGGVSGKSADRSLLPLAVVVLLVGAAALYKKVDARAARARPPCPG